MTKGELVNEIFIAVSERLNPEGSTPEESKAFVGLQGDKIVIMQVSGEHYGLVVVPVHMEVPSNGN
jgi:hypothetical protein